MLCSRRLRTCVVPILLALCTASVLSQSPPRISVDAKEKVVKVGDPFEFICRAGRPIYYCSIKYGSLSLSVRETTKKDDYEYAGNGFQRGDCGVKFASVRENMHGNFTCTVGVEDQDQEGQGFTNLIVAIPPNSIKLTTNKEEYLERDEITMTCSTAGARPPPTVTLYLGNDTLAVSKKAQDFVNFNRQADYRDNNKKLVCKATHQASSKDDIKVTEKTLVVYFKPQPSTFGIINKFGFFEGTEGIISVDVFANPKPTRFDWKVDEAKPDSELYRAVDIRQIRQNEDGSWKAELLIVKVQREDLTKTFSLTATNKYGSETYTVKISFDEKPLEEDTSLGAGSIVAIIVAVLIVFVAIVLTLFARTTGRWCFAAGVPAQGDKEALEDSDTPGKTGGWLSTLTSSYKAVSTREDASLATQPKRLESQINTAPSAVLETNIDDGESGGVLHSSDTESADKVPAAGAAQNAGIRIRNYLRDKINSFKTSAKVPTSEEEAKDVEAAEQKSAPATGSDGVVYAELEMRKPGEAPVIRDDGEKTEYAQIVIPAQNAAKV